MTLTPPPTVPIGGNAANVSGFPSALAPFPNVQPFSYPDGLTFQKLFESYRHWLLTELVPHIDKLGDDIYEAYNAASAALAQAMIDYAAEIGEDRAAYEAVIAADRAAFNATVTQIAANASASATAAAASKTAAKASEDAAQAWAAGTQALQDTAVTNLLNSGTSASRGAAKTLVATQAGIKTKRAAHTWGTAGSYSATPATMSNLGLRRYIRLPVNTTRWRIKVANYDFMRRVAGAAGIKVGSAIFIGRAATDLGQGGGKYVAAPVQALPNPSADIPFNGTAWISDWVTDPAAQLAADAEQIIAFDVTGSTTTSFQSNTRQYHMFGLGTSGQLAPAVSDNSQGYLNLVLEYDYVDDGRHPFGLFVGDSITEGAALYERQKWPNVVSGLTGATVLNMGCSGITAGYLSDPAGPLWSRFDLANYNIDFAYVLLGTNDSNTSNNVTLANYQRDMKLVIDNLNALGVKRIILGNLPPKMGLTAGSAEDVLRKSYRDWLNSMPMGVAGVVDYDSILRDPAAPLQYRADFTNDGIHPVPLGAARMGKEAANLHAAYSFPAN